MMRRLVVLMMSLPIMPTILLTIEGMTPAMMMIVVVLMMRGESHAKFRKTS